MNLEDEVFHLLTPDTGVAALLTCVSRAKAFLDEYVLGKNYFIRIKYAID